MKGWKARIRNERGAVLVMVAVSMVVLLGFAALAVDVGFLLNARTATQRTADAMALAAASAFIDDMENAEALAASRAAEYAVNNPVFGVTADFVPATDMQIWLDEKKVRVTANFLRERGNPMPTYFAKVLGINDMNVNAIAAAEASRASLVGCLTPWAVADMWEDTWTEGGDPGKYDYDDVDRSNTPTTGDSFDNYCPCTRDLVTDTIRADPDYQFNELVCQSHQTYCTGWGSTFRDDVTYKNDVGRVLTLKPGNPAQSWSPGWFMAWRPPENMGGADYKENIINCIKAEMFNDEDIVPIDTEQGNMIGPTIQGVTERIGNDRHHWEPGCTDGTSCVRNWDTTCNEGTPGDDGWVECSGYERRLVVVPLMDPTEVMRNGMTEIQFRGFMRMFLDDPSGNDITAHIIGLGGAAGASNDDAGTGALPLVLRLVE